MGEHDNVDLDRATGLAWSRFRVALGDHIVAMGDDDILVIDAESSLDEEADGAAPYVQFCAYGEDSVRAEVSSNEYLDAEVMLDEVQEDLLVELGWAAPAYACDERPDHGSANFYVDATRREGDRLAVMAVGALRDVFGVPHPAFLSWPPADEPDDAETADADAETADDDAEAWSEQADEPLAAQPRSSEHLHELVESALTAPGGPAIQYDEDGDIPIPTGSGMLYVRVHDEVPVVELFSLVVRGIKERERAAFEVGVLNRDTRMIKFVLLGDSVIASLHLPAVPFAARQLRLMVSMMSGVLDRIDGDLIARVGGRRATDPEPDEDDEAEDSAEETETSLHPALLTLMHLDRHSEGLDPELAAGVCDFDRELVLRLLTTAGEQEIEWRRSGDRLIGEDDEEAEVCHHEGRAWQATVETLRAALRVIVQRQHGQSLPSRARSSESRNRRSRGARRADGAA